MSNVEYINRIRKFIENDELDSALMALSTLLQNSNKLDEAIHQSGRYENIRKQIRLGTVSHSDANLTQNQIRFGLLDLLGEIEKQREDPNMFSEIERAITIVNSKNIVVSSTISANKVHIGDIHNHSGSIDWSGLHSKVFIFHDEAEREWVVVKLIPKLKSLGLEIHLDYRKPTLETFSELGRTVGSCKATLLVFPKNLSHYDQMFSNSLVEEGLKNLIPIRLDDHNVPNFFSQYIALSSKEDSTEHFRQLFARLDPKNFPIFPELEESHIEISAMPNGGEHIHLFGRQRELQILEDAWAKRDCRVLSFTAQGGTGKSALFNRWLADMGRDHFRGAGRVLATSFYSQGTGERVTSADQFINFALRWFGERDFEQRSPWDKGKRLAQLVSEHRTLLVLDGLEPLQEGGVVDTGKVKDPALFTLIRDLAKRNEGLCVITSRLRLGGLERQAAGIRQEDLEQISDEAGKHILRFAGIRGDEPALAGTVRKFGNHALAVNLLGAWLYAQPGHRVEAANEIADLPEVPLERGRHPRRVIAAFEKLLREKGLDEEVRLLRFLGLFDRPVSEEAIAQLHPFQNLYKTLDSLWMLKLIYREKRHPILRKNKEDMVDCHPLIREHYSEVFANNEPEIWQKSHATLYEYYKGLPERLYGKFLPDTLEEMEPLFLAVRHGCFAGKHQEVLEDVYRPRIQRDNLINYCMAHLGAVSADLMVISSFFMQTWNKSIDTLSVDWKASVVSWAGSRLMALGYLDKAIEPFIISNNIAINENNWYYASLISVNLRELFLTMGEIENAIEYGRISIDFADRSKNSRVHEALWAAHADTLFQSGNTKEVENILFEVEIMQKKRQPEYQYLYSFRGFYYNELLISKKKFKEALKRAKTSLIISKQKNRLLEIALDEFIIGKVYFLSSTHGIVNKLSLANYFLSLALDEFRLAGQIHYIPFGLLARAAYHRHTQNYLAAEADLEEVLDIAEPTGMRLHLTDYHLESARLRLAQNRPDYARPHIAEAARLIDETGYHRRDIELLELKTSVKE